MFSSSSVTLRGSGTSSRTSSTQNPRNRQCTSQIPGLPTCLKLFPKSSRARMSEPSTTSASQRNSLSPSIGDTCSLSRIFSSALNMTLGTLGPCPDSHLKLWKLLEGISLSPCTYEAWRIDTLDETWKVFLHGLPRLERICYGRSKEGDGDFVDPFILAFSRPFEGGRFVPGCSV